MATNENQAAAREKYTGKHCSANHGLCNCPNCATDNCTNADDTRLHGLAIAFMALLEASVKEGYDEQPLELAQVWIQQKALSGPVGEGAARLLGITLPQMNTNVTVAPLAARKVDELVGTEIKEDGK